MPVYNSDREEFQAALEAILAQDYGDFELLISDNGSNEESQQLYQSAVHRDPRVRYYRHAENHGAVFNFNYVFSRARGEFFKWAADDDWIAPSWLKKTVALLDLHQDAVSAGTKFTLVDDNNRPVAEPVPPSRFTKPRPSARIAIGACPEPGDYLDIYSLHRRAALERTQLQTPIHGSDVLLVTELLLQGTIRHVEEPLFRYRRPNSYNMDSLMIAMLGAQSRPTQFRHPLQHLGLQMLVSVATTKTPLSQYERAACLTRLSASLLANGWFTVEPRMEFLRASADAATRGERLLAARLMVQASIRSPDALLRPRAWRTLVGMFMDRWRRAAGE